ncbi:MAG: FhaA domain-containing protein [Eubacteriales bacterium]
MGIFSNLEGNLEKLIEGFFKEKSGGRLEPVDIARRLFREMRDKKKVSISSVYVPNEYIISINPSDLEKMSALIKKLAEEMEAYIREKSVAKKYILTGRPAVRIEPGEEIPPGELLIDSAFSAPQPEEPGKEKMEQTQTFKPLKLKEPALRPEPNNLLEVSAGPERGKIFVLKKLPAVIGRSPGCDIVLNDSAISRRHARMDRQGGTYYVDDLDSTNGTSVNGAKIAGSVRLSPGDEITVGTTVFLFKVD